MVSEDGKRKTLNVVAKVFYCEEDGQKLPIKRAVLPLSIGKLPGEESHRASRSCSSCPPTALSEASTVMLVLALESG